MTDVSKLRQAIDLPDTLTPVVIFGAGSIVSDAHLPAYRAIGVPVAGIFDPDVEKARGLAADWGNKAFETAEDAAAEQAAGPYASGEGGHYTEFLPVFYPSVPFGEEAEMKFPKHGLVSAGAVIVQTRAGAPSTRGSDPAPDWRMRSAGSPAAPVRTCPRARTAAPGSARARARRRCRCAL